MSGQPIDDLPPPAEGPWYAGITRYQWLVLVIASLGWVFDIFEGQIFVASMNEAMPSLVPAGTDKGTIAYYNQVTLAAFLLGGAIGGVLFGMLSDRIGRKKTMSLTIIMYSLFTCISAFSMSWWHMVIFRFLVAMGVGGEWAVASSMVAEEFPKKAERGCRASFMPPACWGRIWPSPRVCCSSATSKSTNGPRRSAIRALPGGSASAWACCRRLLIIWIRRSLKEPESWLKAKSRAQETPAEEMGRIADLFRGDYLVPTLVGVTLASVGLATFWGAHIYGKDLLRRDVEKEYLAKAPPIPHRSPKTKKPRS